MLTMHSKPLPWYSLTRLTQSCKGSQNKREARPATLLRKGWLKLRNRAKSEANPVEAELKSLAELEALKSLLRSNGWHFLQVHMQAMAEDWAEALLSLQWSTDDTADVFLSKVVQAQNIISTLRQVAELPHNVIEQLEDKERP